MIHYDLLNLHIYSSKDWPKKWTWSYETSRFTYIYIYRYLTWNNTCIRLPRHCAVRGLLAPAAVAQCLANGTHPSLRKNLATQMLQNMFGRVASYPVWNCFKWAPRFPAHRNPPLSRNLLNWSVVSACYPKQTPSKSKPRNANTCPHWFAFMAIPNFQLSDDFWWFLRVWNHQDDPINHIVSQHPESSGKKWP